MVFRTAQDGGVCFVYVMPSGSRQALVEHTRFATRPAASGDQALRAYLNDVVPAAPYQVVRREGTRLPLRLPRPRPAAGHIMPIGIRGGMLKASTGYEYGRIQRDSAAIARSLADQGHPFAPQITRRRHAYLVAVLLDVLAAEPDRLESTFLGSSTGTRPTSSCASWTRTAHSGRRPGWSSRCRRCRSCGPWLAGIAGCADPGSSRVERHVRRSGSSCARRAGHGPRPRWPPPDRSRPPTRRSTGTSRPLSPEA